MIGFQPGVGWFYSLHPFTKLGVAILVSMAGLFAPAAEGAATVMGGAVLLLLVARVPAALRPVLALSLPFWVFLFIIHGLLRDRPDVALSIGSRVTTIIVVFTAAMTAIHPGRLVEALVAVRAPFGVVYLVSATIQAIPRLGEHAHAVLEAQRCRGLRVRETLLGRVRALIPLVVPLVLGALTEVDERALALETRGAGSGVRRTSLDAPRSTVLDFVVLAGAVTAVSAVFWMRFVR